MISNIFNVLIYQPLLNLTVFLYNFVPVHNLGIVIIILTVLIKLLLHPLSIKGLKSQKVLQQLEPQLKKIREEFKNDQEKATRKILSLYQKAEINPFSGILLLFLQVPVLLGLYKVFAYGILNNDFGSLYFFISFPEKLNPFFVGIDLSKPFLLLAALASLFQFLQTKIQIPNQNLAKKNISDFSEMMKKQAFYIFPFFTFLILARIPSAISLYLLTSSIFSIFELKYLQQTI